MGMFGAISTASLTQLEVPSDEGVEYYDLYEVVSWVPGELPRLARENGLGALEAATRDLPSWFRYLVNATTGQPVVPTLLFLAEQCRLRRESHAAKNTLVNYAYDFRGWFEFLALEGVAWDKADQQVFNEYVLDMASDDDGGCASKTIQRRGSALKQLYKDARSRRLTDADFATRLATDVGRLPELTIRPISPDDIKTLRNILGPLPSERQPGRFSRLRLAFEISLFTGLRLFEVVALITAQFRGLPFDPDTPDVEEVVKLTVTKGGTEQDALFPHHLLQEIDVFIRTERQESVNASGSIAHSDRLFLNHQRTGGNAGRPMSTATLSRDFRRAVRAAGLTRPLPGAHRYGTGRSTTPHTFHDVRHSFAVLKFLALRGHVEDPWDEIRIRMRHKIADTTKDIYLVHIGEFAPGIPVQALGGQRMMLA